MATRGVQPTMRTFLLGTCEAGLILAAVYLAAWIRLGPDAADLLLNQRGILKALLVTTSCQFCLYYADLYDLRMVTDWRELSTRTLQALGATSLILAVVYYWAPKLIVGRGVFAIAVALIIVVTIGWRVLFVWTTKLVNPRERILIAGANASSTQLASELYDRRAELGVAIVGFVDTDPEEAAEGRARQGVIGSLDDIPRLVREYDVDRVVVSLTDARGKLAMDKLLDMRMAGVTFAHLVAVYEEYTGKIAIDNLRPSWLIFSEGFSMGRIFRAVTRSVDLAGSATLLVFSLPFLAVSALAIKLTSPGPVFYEQQRVGMNGRVFSLHKLRSMRNDAEAETGAVWANPGSDPRVTPVGRFLRRSRLDELPQLWNVIRGDMSLVGPRPERPEFVKGLTQEIPYYGQRHVVRPGLTGWAQVRYAYGASVEDSMEKLQYDLFYIKNRSVGLYLYIIFETLKTIVTRSGS
jgi:sugar transferase (PEP-CTERM system associated)